MEPTAPNHLQRVSPYMAEIGRNDAQVDARAGDRDRYATYLAFLSEGHLSAPD